jgi:hypothetical protein
MIKKPVPSLTPVITKIMDVVWIEDLIEYEKVSHPTHTPVQTTLMQNTDEPRRQGVITKSKIVVANYKQKPQKFCLYAVIPEDSVVGDITPKPMKTTSRYLKWKLENIPPADKIDINFELAGLEEGDFDENDLYIEQINPSFVIGADKWEGGE